MGKNKKPPKARGRVVDIEFPLARVTHLLLLLGWRLLGGLLCSLFGCVLHRVILPNVKFAIYRDRSVIHI
jgi:hypothetical protein